MPRTVKFTVEQGDIRAYKADVAALKFARNFYGADQAVANALAKVNINAEELQPPIGNYRYLETNNGITAPYVLYVGVTALRQFRYEQIRQLAIDTLQILAHEAPGTRHVAMIVHGPGYGLDEAEACSQQFAGCVEALLTGQAPAALEAISFVERSEDRVKRFRETLDEQLTKAGYARETNGWVYQLKMKDTPDERVTKAAPAGITPAEQSLAQSPVQSSAKSHAFIAMPFADEWDDVFYYGIQTPVHSAGLLCERVDKSAFTGDIMGYVRQRIETASVVIAEISNANPNVYLEVGYAWGRERPTVLIVQNDKELHFDVQGQKCLTYKKIKDLETSLDRELKGMIAKGIIK